MVLRLHAAARDVRVGRLPAGRDPDGMRGGRLPGLRRHDPRRDLARLHDGRDAGPARRVVHRAVVRRTHDRAGDAGVRPDAEPQPSATPSPSPPAPPARPATGPTGPTGGTGADRSRRAPRARVPPGPTGPGGTRPDGPDQVASLIAELDVPPGRRRPAASRRSSFRGRVSTAPRTSRSRAPPARASTPAPRGPSAGTPARGRCRTRPRRRRSRRGAATWSSSTVHASRASPASAWPRSRAPPAPRGRRASPGRRGSRRRPFPRTPCGSRARCRSARASRGSRGSARAPPAAADAGPTSDARRPSASSASSLRIFVRISMPRSLSPALIISSAASSESDAADTPCTGPSCRSRAMRLRSASIALFVRRSRRVRSSSRSWRNLKSERIVWSAILPGRHVAHEQQPARRRHGHLGDAGLQVERLPLGPLDRALPGRGERRERRHRRPSTEAARAVHGRPSIDSRSMRDHAAERVVRPQDHVAVVELDDAVDGRLEDQPEVLLGLAQGLVRLADAFEREVGLGEGALLVAQARAWPRAWACVLADLVREDARRDPQPEHGDDRRRLDRGEPARVVERWPRWRAPRTPRRRTRS